MTNFGSPHLNSLYQIERQLRIHNFNPIVSFSHCHLKFPHSFHRLHHKINHPPHNSRSWFTLVLEHKPPLPNHLQLLEHLALHIYLQWLRDHGQIQEMFLWQDPYIHSPPIQKIGYQISILMMAYQLNNM